MGIGLGLGLELHPKTFYIKTNALKKKIETNINLDLGKSVLCCQDFNFR